MQTAPEEVVDWEPTMPAKQVFVIAGTSI